MTNNTPLNADDELDEILTRLENMVEGFTVRRIRGNTRDMVSPKSIHAEAKQAITSLIKELVAEAKPEYKRPEDAQVRSDMFEWMGYNKAIDEFEQNLLKELEEV